MKERKRKCKYMYIYLTTNMITGKRYVGQHAANDKINDYFGSGLLLNKAIKKYGKSNFTKEIIENCVSEQQLNKREEYWIKEKNTINPNGYNISGSGYGNGTRGVEPWNKEKHDIYSKETIEKMTKKLKLINVKGCKGHPRSEECKRKIGEKNKINSSGENNGMYGKHHSQESRDKMSKNMQGRIPWNKGKKIKREL
jgi:group I intron endonuclease